MSYRARALLLIFFSHYLRGDARAGQAESARTNDYNYRLGVKHIVACPWPSRMHFNLNAATRRETLEMSSRTEALSPPRFLPARARRPVDTFGRAEARSCSNIVAFYDEALRATINAQRNAAK